jgi:hypothetical protein
MSKSKGMKGVSKTRGMGLQDEKMKPGKTMKAMYGKMATMKTGKMVTNLKQWKNNGKVKGSAVFYASENKGTIKGVKKN